ncbi:hypothetical protein Y032_0010g966 [Ancylostoma ceylanicum]|uniref:Uncharacterized protein n=1 Tax=Ancylostoma ceylanicum TaxID=53326 RepID=A0A016VJ40_9BILA|nr:hypothetical protein Y032_0010g966 [Ancylostoma ceylanicum]
MLTSVLLIHNIHRLFQFFLPHVLKIEYVRPKTFAAPCLKKCAKGRLFDMPPSNAAKRVGCIQVILNGKFGICLGFFPFTAQKM